MGAGGAEKSRALPKKKAYYVFEGGGAKGIAHAGVVVALEKSDHFDPQGYAGTSAGAIIASLLAVGYQPHEIFNLDLENGHGRIANILDQLPKWYGVAEPIDLFTRFDWWKMRLARFLVRVAAQPSFGVASSLKIALILLLFPALYIGWIGLTLLLVGADTGALLLSSFLFVAAAGVFGKRPGFMWGAFALFWTWLGVFLFDPNVFRSGDHFFLTNVFLAGHCIVTIVFVGLILFMLRRFRGVASLDKFVECMDCLFRQKLRLNGADVASDRPITFGDLDKQGIVLKVVAANFTLKTDMVFASDDARCADIPVAEAVAASVAIPFAFVPRKIAVPFQREELEKYLSNERINDLLMSEPDSSPASTIHLTCMFCDGGVVSNLPAWVFDGQTGRDRDCWVVTSEIADISNQVWYSGRGLKFVFRLLNTAIFGSSRLNVRQVPNILRLESRPALDVFEFDASARKLYSDTLRAFARARLEIAELSTEEIKLARIHERIRERFQEFIDESAGFRLRAALVERIAEHNYIRLWSHVGFDGFADKWLELPLPDTMVERCLSATDEADILNFDLQEDRELFELKSVDDRIRARTPADVRWSMACKLPELAEEKPRSIALAVDCNFHLCDPGPDPSAGLLTDRSLPVSTMDKAKVVEIVTEIAQSVWINGSARQEETAEFSRL